MIDHRDFKTPFFTIRVGRGKDTPDQFIPLSPQLMKLVERVEIIETLGLECTHTAVANITFREGSREPYVQIGNLSSNNLYDDATEELSNTTGMLTDLAFTSEGGLKAIVNQIENQAGQLVPTNKALAQAQSGILDVATSDIIAINPSSVNNTVENYLFYQGNRIEITWGYKESNLDIPQRVVTLSIMAVQVTYPESGSVTTLVTCTGPSGILDRYVPAEPPKFYLSIPFAENVIMSTKEVILKLQTMFSTIEFNVSSELLAPTLGKSHAYVWPAGQSLMEFLRKFSIRHGMYLDTRIDTKTGKYLIYLVNKRDYDKLRLQEDINLFSYKHPDSILKSVDLRFAPQDTGALFSGIDDTGKQIKQGSEMGEKAQVKVSDPAPYVSGDLHGTEQTAKELKDNTSPKGAITFVENSPEANNKPNMIDQAEVQAACRNKNTIALEFISLGLPALRPIVVNFEGLGKRFSGPYKVQVITHLIDSTGYTCKGTATSNLDYGSTQDSTNVGIPGTRDPDKQKVIVTDNLLNNLTSSIDPIVSKHDAAVLNKDTSLLGKITSSIV